METKYDFKEQNKLPFVKEAENRCIKYLKGQGEEVIDVSNNEKYYKLGIDILVKEPDGYVNIDVKADEKISSTGNIFYELIECLWKNCSTDIKFGWGFNTRLHYIYYVDVKNWKLYIIDHNELYEFIWNKNFGQYRMIPHEKYKTLGFLIPLKELNYEEVNL